MSGNFNIMFSCKLRYLWDAVYGITIYRLGCLIIQSLGQITNLVSADEHLSPHREDEVPRPRPRPRPGLAAAQVPPPAPHTGILSAELPRLHILVSIQIYTSLHSLYRSSLDPVPVWSCPWHPPPSHTAKLMFRPLSKHTVGIPVDSSPQAFLFCCYNLFIYIKSYSF